MDSVNDFLSSIPQSVVLTFAGLGALFVASKLLSFLSLFLSVFILSGTNVCFPIYILLFIPTCPMPSSNA